MTGASHWVPTLEPMIYCIQVFSLKAFLKGTYWFLATMPFKHFAQFSGTYLSLTFNEYMYCIIVYPYLFICTHFFSTMLDKIVFIFFRCDIVDVVVEMDRILRPNGYIVIQDTMEMIDKLRPILHSLQWSSTVHQDRVLIGQKGFWRPARFASRSWIKLAFASFFPCTSLYISIC